MALKPERGPSFFDLLAQLAGKLIDASDLLRELLFASSDDRSGIRERLHDVEHEADELNHTFISKINQSFITPFDREDLASLAHLLDDCVDLMDEAGDMICLYKMVDIPEDFERMMGLQVEVLHKCSVLTAQAMPKLKKPMDLKPYWLEINILENQGDQAYRRTIGHLFDSGLDPVTLIKIKDVVLVLEKCTDAFEALAHGVEAIAVKES